MQAHVCISFFLSQPITFQRRMIIKLGKEAEVMQLEEMMMWVKDNAASGITTGIENMEHSPSATDHYYYDLQGRRVEHPTKGLYIVNGRKVVVE